MHKKKGVRPPAPYEGTDTMPMTTEERFMAGKDLAEGISGRAEIDTTYEQTDYSYISNPSRRK